MAVFGRLVRTVLKPDKCRAAAYGWLSDTQLQRSLFLSFLKKRRGNECVVKSAGSRWIFFYYMVSRSPRVCNVSKVTDGRHLFPWRRRCEAYQTFGKKNFWRVRHPFFFGRYRHQRPIGSRRSRRMCYGQPVFTLDWSTSSLRRRVIKDSNRL